jgi:hypothetical protein
MGRELRMVPEGWEHPKNELGRYVALYSGDDYQDAVKEFEEVWKEKGLQEAIEWCGAPDKNDYMPEWAESEKTHFQMYETTSEGTPISPPMPTPEALAKWLVDNNASAFGRSTASYESWLATIQAGYAPSAVLTGGKMISGVEANQVLSNPTVTK